MSITTAAELTSRLEELISEAAEDGDFEGLGRLETFTSAGIMSSNQGLVVQVDGAEFQIQVIRSR